MSSKTEDTTLVGDAGKKYEATGEKGITKESSENHFQTNAPLNDGNISSEDKEDFAPALVLSCLVFWLCGVLLGLVAFVLALFGKNESDKGRRSRGWKVASYVVSAIGILIGLAVVVAVLYLHKSRPHPYP